MIFTIGHTESYFSYFAANAQPQKKGADENYPGGSVWRTREEAAARALLGYSVFGVEAEWGIHTRPSLDMEWHDLLIDADLKIL